MAFLAAALSGPASAQDAGQGAGRERGDRSWADEVRSAIGGGRSGKGGDGGQGGNEAPVRSDMQTGSTGKGAAPGKPEKK